MNGLRHTDVDFDILGTLAGRIRIRARGHVEVTRRWDAERRTMRPAPPAPTVRDLLVPAPVRLAQSVASAAIVRDAAAFGALVLFATMLAVLCNLDPMV